MNKALAFLVPFVLIVLVGVGTWWWSQRPEPRGNPVEMPLYDIDPSEPFVRVRGTAHYPVVIKQHEPGGLLTSPRTFYLFPLFPEGDTQGREVRVLVRTLREPERLVSYEVMAIEGRVSFPTKEKVPFQTEIELGKRSDYFFSDSMVLLEPWRVEVEGEETWELPQ